LTMNEVNDAATIITQSADPDANIIFGATIREDLGDDIQISVIAAGFDSIRHFAPSQSVTTYFKPAGLEPVQELETVKPEPVMPKSIGKYKLEHDEVDIEDDLDIPTFLRNKN